ITSPESHSVVSDPIRFAVGRASNPFGSLPQLVTTDGHERRIDLRGAPLNGPDGRVQGAILVMRDLTLQHNALTNLEHAKQMEAMGQLAGGAAHDLNNLLTPIISYVELVQRRVDPLSKEATFLVHVQEAAQRAATLTRQLLALSRKQVLDVQVVPLDELIRQTAPMLERLVGDDIRVVLKLRDHGAKVRVDLGQFEQVLLNLTSNARDAITGPSGQLVISTRRVGEHEVAVEVADNGSGMPQDILPKIFEPFFTTKPRGKGTGLGLASVRGIIEQQGGKIYVDSEQGKGTSFEIILPLSSTDQRLSSTRHTPPGDLARGNETILVAEDDPAVRALIY
ncbi:MAG TPA: ATP-binding protein, partial [Polyangiaceae bacterium]|nr:ATP-binding protein [Polyangiaceae bacterium]